MSIVMNIAALLPCKINLLLEISWYISVYLFLKNEFKLFFNYKYCSIRKVILCFILYGMLYVFDWKQKCLYALTNKKQLFHFVTESNKCYAGIEENGCVIVLIKIDQPIKCKKCINFLGNADEKINKISLIILPLEAKNMFSRVFCN